MRNGEVQSSSRLSFAAPFPIYFLSIWGRKAESRTVAVMKSFCLQTLSMWSLNTRSSNFTVGYNAPCHMCLLEL
jgi:hypothetical protein